MKQTLLIFLLLVSLCSCAVTLPAAGVYYLSKETENPTHNFDWNSAWTKKDYDAASKSNKELELLRFQWNEIYIQELGLNPF